MCQMDSCSNLESFRVIASKIYPTSIPLPKKKQNCIYISKQLEKGKKSQNANRII